MDNSFAYIKIGREKRAQEETIAKKKAEQVEQQREEQFNALRAQYEDLVVSVLKDLRDIAYPDQGIDTNYYREGNSPCWYVGYQYESFAGSRDHAGEQGTLTFHVSVGVCLETDTKGTPKGFRCWRDNKKESRAGLSRDSLIMALKSLHPVGT